MARKKENLIGHRMVEKGLITARQLKYLVGEQRKMKGRKERIGEMALRHGFIEEKKLVPFLEEFLGISYANLKEMDINPDTYCLKAIPENIAHQYNVVPIKFDKDANKLVVAMSNPFDVMATDTLKMRTGYELDIKFSFPAEIEEALGKVYKDAAMRKSIDEFIDLKSSETEKAPKVLQAVVDAESGVKTPVIQFVDQILKNAVKDGASDVHIEPCEDRLRIRYRMDGILVDITPPPKEMQSAIITRLKLLSNMDIAEQRLPQDGRFKFLYNKIPIDVRVASSPIIYGEKLVMRLLDSSKLLVKMEDLGMEPDNLIDFKSILKNSYGMVLVTGPTGSGKTTTLYSALNFINTPDKNIVTIEDPVEYQLANINQIQTKHQIGLTFASGLRTVLRQDPDIIMIGEIRDLETLENAVKASLTGHLVLSTIHTNNAPSTIMRMTHMGLEPYLISSCLSLVIAQRLVRKICENCKEKIPFSQFVLKGLERRVNMNLGNINFYKGKGCPKCRNTGYKGRTGLYEFFVITKNIKAMILEGKSEAELKAEGVKGGMRDIFQAGLRKVNDGIITIDELLRVTVLEKDATK